MKEAGVHLKNAEAGRSAPQTNDDSSDRPNKGNNKRRGNVSIGDKTNKKRGGIKRRRSIQNTESIRIRIKICRSCGLVENLLW